ncbi:Double-stranded RNA-binding protein 1 [Camellia lanceoleosa]|uniref:Double-stranded RNA-binding protein 1 n=1 Tax=Camellia lanceoleosa TaxID=1840588 RepID=A0ACC0GPL8_9ERIC|nr:Double-stranded RNA-binding protein 1 [Camellia lanceoleosa]
MYKNRLQEYTQKSSIPLPVYKTINEGGVPHEPRFRSTVRVDGASYTSHDVFSQRKAAEQDVARVALDDPPELAMYKNRLQEYTQKSSIPLPVYKTINEGGVPHELRFRSTVWVDGASYTSNDVFSQRKAAEQDVARVALDGITQKILIREIYAEGK